MGLAPPRPLTFTGVSRFVILWYSLSVSVRYAVSAITNAANIRRIPRVRECS